MTGGSDEEAHVGGGRSSSALVDPTTVRRIHRGGGGFVVAWASGDFKCQMSNVKGSSGEGRRVKGGIIGASH